MAKRLLWIGDAVAATGFAKCTHKILATLKQSYEVSVLGINYLGDPHQYPYRIYPAWTKGDGMGFGRVEVVTNLERPDVVVIQNDPWNVPIYTKALKKHWPDALRVGAIAIDGKNCMFGAALNDLDAAIFWTAFGLQEAREGGFEKPARVIPLGVDTKLYKPMDQQDSRKKLGLPEELWGKYILGAVNRNQPRKRLDLTVRFYCEWVKRHDIRDSLLLFYKAPTAEEAYELPQLMKYLGNDHTNAVVIQPPLIMGLGEEFMPHVFSSLDALMVTSQGEGWGFTPMEAMACGVPVIAPKHSAFDEWPEDKILLVPTTPTCTPNGKNVIGGVPEMEGFIDQLQALYEKKEYRYKVANRGLLHVNRKKFHWSKIGESYLAALGSFHADRG